MDNLAGASQTGTLTPSWYTRALTAAALFGLVLLAYAPVVRNGWVWDDDHYITHTRPRDLASLVDIWIDPSSTPQYYPLVHTAFWVEHHLYGTHPLGYHVVNALVHALGSVLVWRVLKRLGIPAAWLAAAIFAVHPLGVESVAWATERKNTMSLAFGAGSLLALLRFYRIGDDASPAGRTRWGWLALSVLLFLLALWSKTVIATLPCVAALILWWKRRPLNLATLAPLAAMLLLAAPFCLLTSHLERHHVGAIGQDWDFSWVERCLIAGRAVCFYAGKLAWPKNLTFIYERWAVDAASPTQWAYPLAVVVVLAIAAWLAWRGMVSRGVAVGLLAFVGMLTPALGFFDVYPMRFSFVADHFAYHASVPLIALVVGGTASILARRQHLPRHVCVAAAAVLVIGLTTLTARRACDFRDSETLWLDTLAKNPQAIIAHFNLTHIRFAQGRVTEAESYLRQAAAARPDHPLPWEGMVWLYRALGRYDEAEAAARGWLSRLHEVTPARGGAHAELAWLLSRRGADAEAAEHFKRATELRPDDEGVWSGLVGELRLLGRHEEMLATLQRWSAAQPKSAQPLKELGIALQETGDVSGAALAYEKALAIESAHAPTLNNLAVLRMQEGRREDAIARWYEAVAADPNHLDAQQNLGLALAQAGRLDLAAPHLEKAHQLAPDRPVVLKAMAALALSAGDALRARDLAQRATAMLGDADPGALDLFSIAAAATGDERAARDAAERAIAAAEARGDGALAASIRERLRQLPP